MLSQVKKKKYLSDKKKKKTGLFFLDEVMVADVKFCPFSQAKPNKLVFRDALSGKKKEISE